MSEVEALDPHVFSDESASRWTQKGVELAAPLITLAGPAGRPGPVRHETVHSPTEWPYGRFMGAWLDDNDTTKTLKHLPDVRFFMRLLTLAYAPILLERPDRRNLLGGDSRLEMSLTNDALQIQLVTISSGYSMIRHHALMLFEAALWLEEPGRSAWFELYDDLVTVAEDRPGGLPGLADLERLEARAFSDFSRLASRTWDEAEGDALLRDGMQLRDILDYQFYAGVAIGLLWRDFRSLDPAQRSAWQVDQLSRGYLDSDYLTTTWTEHR